MNKNFSSYKFISRLKCLRIIFLSFLFIFLANYMFNVCSSFLDISSTSYEISKRFEGEQSEEKENERETERETEIEDSDELFLLFFSNFSISLLICFALFSLNEVNLIYPIFFSNKSVFTDLI